MPQLRRSGSRRPVLLLIVACALLVASGCGESPDPVQPADLRVEQHLSLTEAEATPAAAVISAPAIRHRDRRRPSLRQVGPSTIAWNGLETAPKSTLLAHFEPGDPSSGAQARVLCRPPPEKQSKDLLTLWQSEAAQSKVTVDLEPCSSPLDLALEVTCPKSPCSAVYWVEPRIESVVEERLLPTRLAILISIDTLRPDYLGAYGAEPSPSPNLDALARRALVFDEAWAPSPWTIPSHATLLTGFDPVTLGIGRGKSPLADSVPRLADTWRDLGWRTAAFVDTPFLDRKHGFGKGFDHFDDETPGPGAYRRGAHPVVGRIIDWLLDVPDEQPVFLFWHLMDTHSPYRAPSIPELEATILGHASETARERLADPAMESLRRLETFELYGLNLFDRFQEVEEAYRDAIGLADDAIGQLLDFLATANRLDSAMIVVTSDHGERLLDDGLTVGHGLFLEAPELRIPLIAKMPGSRHVGRSDAFLGLIDVGASMLRCTHPDIADAALPGTGQSLWCPELRGREGWSDGLLLASANLEMEGLLGPEGRVHNGSRLEPSFLVKNRLRLKDGFELTPQDSQTLARLVEPATSGIPARRREAALLFLASKLREAEQANVEQIAGGAEAAQTLDEEEIQRLRALGYILDD